jgi:hypothetical protein
LDAHHDVDGSQCPMGAAAAQTIWLGGTMANLVEVSGAAAMKLIFQ